MGTRDTSAAADHAPSAATRSAPHDHRWSGVEFFLEDDHPWFRMRCACGAERAIRAWERYSDPDPDVATEAPAVGATEVISDG
jgi:hypothetical protein